MAPALFPVSVYQPAPQFLQLVCFCAFWNVPALQLVHVPVPALPGGQAVLELLAAFTA